MSVAIFFTILVAMLGWVCLPFSRSLFLFRCADCVFLHYLLHTRPHLLPLATPRSRPFLLVSLADNRSPTTQSPTHPPNLPPASLTNSPRIPHPQHLWPLSFLEQQLGLRGLFCQLQMLLIPLCPHFRLFCLLGKPSRQSWKSLILAGGRECFRVERRGSGLVGRGRKVRVDKDRGGEDDERVAPGRREEGLTG